MLITNIPRIHFLNVVLCFLLQLVSEVYQVIFSTLSSYLASASIFIPMLGDAFYLEQRTHSADR